MNESPPPGDTIAASPSAVGAMEEADTPEDARTQRRRLAAVWLAAGSALAAMVAVSWYVVVRTGGPPGGDMEGHAAAAEWLRTLPWWDWRGWSDWFYGGQAMGVNYPPLGHAWMRFTDPVHGQMAAVAVGLLVLLPWGTMRLARAVGYAPRVQRAAVAVVLVLVAASAGMHWVLSGFHLVSTFFGSWPAMLASVLGLFCGAWAARGVGPVTCGAVAGVAVLFNATVIPGVAVVCLALLATSGASFRQAVRWAATAGAAGLAVCAWWLVPFVAGWDRLVRWEVPLSTAWGAGGAWQLSILAGVGVAAASAARRGRDPVRRLAGAAGVGLLAALAGDLFGYLRVERWLEVPLLVAAVAVASLVGGSPGAGRRAVRPAWALLGAAFLVVFVVIVPRPEVVPLAVWLLAGGGARRSWLWGGALAWAAVLVFVPLWGMVRGAEPSEPLPPTHLAAAAVHGGPEAEGLVFANDRYNTVTGDVANCGGGDPWETTVRTAGRLRPLVGLYRESSITAEFLYAEESLRRGAFHESGGVRPHWHEAWEEAESPSLNRVAAAEALGARWYTTCDDEGDVVVTELPGVLATGAAVVPIATEEAWHRAAVEWWIATAAGDSIDAGDVPVVPVLSSGEGAAHPPGRSAGEVALHASDDSLTVRVESAGWVWLRVPWDPHWRAPSGSPVRKGGPGHLVVWAERGVTELRWGVPGAVDVAAAATTGAAVFAVAVLAVLNRRRGWELDPDRRRPAAEAVGVFADVIDGWVEAAPRRARRLAGQSARRR